MSVRNLSSSHREHHQAHGSRNQSQASHRHHGAQTHKYSSSSNPEWNGTTHAGHDHYRQNRHHDGENQQGESSAHGVIHNFMRNWNDEGSDAGRSKQKDNSAFQAALDNAYTGKPAGPPTENTVAAWADYWSQTASTPEQLAQHKQDLEAARKDAEERGVPITKELWDTLPWSAKDAYQADHVKASTWQNGYVQLEKDGLDYNRSQGGSGEGKLTLFKSDGLNLVAEQKLGDHPSGNPNVAHIDESKLRVGEDLVVFGQKDKQVSINGESVEIGPEGLQLADGSTIRATPEGDYQVSTEQFDLKVKYWFNSDTGVERNGTSDLPYFQNFEVENKVPGPVQASGLLGDVMTAQNLKGPDEALHRQSSLWHSDLSPWYAPDFDNPQ